VIVAAVVVVVFVTAGHKQANEEQVRAIQVGADFSSVFQSVS